MSGVCGRCKLFLDKAGVRIPGSLFLRCRAKDNLVIPSLRAKNLICESWGALHRSEISERLRKAGRKFNGVTPNHIGGHAQQARRCAPVVTSGPDV